jgi:hypothetical protein
MLSIAAALLFASTAMTDVSSQCLTELGYDSIPTQGSQLYLYRRCLTTKRKHEELEKEFESDLQRVDQNFWTRKEAGDRRSSALLQGNQRKGAHTRQRNALQLAHPVSRRAVIQNAARSRNRALRLQEKSAEY